VVHFLNKGGIPWGKSSQRGKGSGVAGRPDRRQWHELERDEERERMRG
jgi:hypothetical protein